MHMKKKSSNSIEDHKNEKSPSLSLTSIPTLGFKLLFEYVEDILCINCMYLHYLR